MDPAAQDNGSFKKSMATSCLSQTEFHKAFGQ